jgi:integrase
MAEQFEREQLHAQDRGAMIDPNAGRITVAAWAAEWLASGPHRRSSTKRIYETNLRLHVLPVLGEHELAGLTSTICSRWLQQVATEPTADGVTLAAGTVHQVYRTFQTLLRAAASAGRLNVSPLGVVTSPKGNKREMLTLTADQVATLADTIDERYRALVLVAAWCRPRASEMAGLRWNRVDLLGRRITIFEQLDREDGKGFVTSTTKTAKGVRHVPIPKVVAAALQEHLEAGRGESGHGGLVFTSPKGSPLDMHSFRSRFWRPATDAAGIPPVTIHEMRHTCASLSLAAGVDIKMLQQILGHASAAMTLDLYGHLILGRHDAYLERLDRMAEEALPTPSSPIVQLAPRAKRAHGK